ncbi:glycosyltransferase [Aeromonas veronii]|uniref:glycosyltransferase n=1 Tax=Aeromonas veronii TaxID=654 RepID=UPI00214D6309|nr:glycosyltransferase [Aeromonas veronii]MCR3970793.1 glycosyltransferase [Aeromonas veronii]MCR3974761.1 glycosyltransferase [Aeromonas veronii]
MKRNNGKTKVLLVAETISKLAMAKSERVIQLAEYLNKKGYYVIVLTSKDQENYIFPKEINVISTFENKPYFNSQLLNRVINPFQDSMLYTYIFGYHSISGQLNDISFDIVISSGPPHSIHWIASQIVHQKKAKWVLDLRDAWRDNRMFKYGTYFHRIASNYIYKKYLSCADLVLANTDKLRDVILSHGVCDEDHLITIPNGYIEEHFKDLYGKNIEPQYEFLYSGSSYNLESVKKIENIFTELHGHFSDQCVSFLGDDFDGFKYCKSIGKCEPKQVPSVLLSAKILILYLPQEEEESARVLLKLYSYLKSGRPIILIGPRSSTSDLIEKYTDLYLVNQNDPAGFLKAYNKIIKTKNYFNHKVKDMNLSYDNSFDNLHYKMSMLSTKI